MPTAAKSEAILRFGTLVGAGKRMQRIFALIEKTAEVDMPVLILGETGTGKELVAREIHNRSMRRDKPFVPVNMGAIPLELLGSELFGHEKGSFTGAAGPRIGRFQEARGGSLFLDEILTMDDRLQVALLHVLENGKYRRIGGQRDLNADVRILAAANEDPLKRVRTKQFRVDLLHRLQVLRINIPPLRRRKSDIPILVCYFLGQMAEDYENISHRISKEAMKAITAHTWPGNVRELRNVLYHSAIVAGGVEIQPEHLPEQIFNTAFHDDISWLKPHAEGVQPRAPLVASPPTSAAISPESHMGEGVFFPLGLSLEEVERAYVLKTLALLGNNKTKAAERLGVSRKTLYTKLARWKILV
ncbi:MAG: sigma-54 dependent transcriptional regulator [bacterium]